TKSVSEYDHIVTHIVDMADTLSAGIVTQFPDPFSAPSAPDAQVAVKDSMRVLWEDHVAWTRLYIVSAVAGLPDTDATLNRLLQNQTDIGNASARWYANADDIATFLAGANPAWPVATLKDMMKTHLDQTLAEATAQLTGDYTKSVSEYDHIVTHIVDMADTLSAGIVTQFPDRFMS